MSNSIAVASRRKCNGNDSPPVSVVLSQTRAEWLRLSDKSDCLKLPRAAVCELGSAAKTLGAYLKRTNKETYRAASDFAAIARLPIDTVKDHFEKIYTSEWLVNDGRKTAPNGFRYLKTTKRMPEKARQLLRPYSLLPFWVCDLHLPWSAEVIFSVVISKAFFVKKQAGEQGESIEAMTDSLIGCFTLPTEKMLKFTGLSKAAFFRGKALLLSNGLLAKGYPSEVYVPNWEYVVESQIHPC
jgi:hypothetical protein